MCRQMPQVPEERNSNRFKQSLNTSETSMDSPKWYRHAASNPGHDRSKCLTVFSLASQCGQVAVISSQ